MVWRSRGMLRPWPAVGWLAALISLLIHGGPIAVNAVPAAAHVDGGSFRRAAVPEADAHSGSTDQLSDEDGSDDADTDDGDDGPDVEQSVPGTTTGAPAAVSLGPNGYPQLPSVSNIFNAASRTLQAIAEQAKMLQGRATSAGKADEARLGHEKQVYEKKLKHQEQENRKLAESVTQTKARIQALHLNNAAIKNHSIALQKSNELMRQELAAIEQRLRVSQDFAARTLETTDDSMVKELEVLQHQNMGSAKSVEAEDADSDADDGADGDADADDSDADDDGDTSVGKISQKPTSRSAAPSSQPVAQTAVAVAPSSSKEQSSTVKNLMAVQQARKVNSQEDTDDDAEEDDRDGSDADDDDDYDEDEDEDNINDTKTSFLALGTKRTRSRLRMNKVETPAATAGRSLIADIGTNIQTLADQEQQSQTHLHELYDAAWKAGEQKHAALMEEWGKLNETEKSLLVVQAKLKGAEAHLRSTQSQLEEHLRAEGLFTQRLAHLALAPSSEAPRLLEAVPDHIALPSVSKKGATHKKAAALVRMAMPTVQDPTPA